MRPPSSVLRLGVICAGMVACSSNSKSIIGPPAVDCTNPTQVALNIGESRVIDPTGTGGCVELAPAGPGGARHLVVALSGSGTVTNNGIFGAYALSTGNVAPAPPAPPVLSAFAGPAAPERFHLSLREQERFLARSPEAAFLRPVQPAAATAIPPTVGSQRTFQVCASISTCKATQFGGQFVSVTATAMHVGPRGAIYLDNTVPAGGFTQSDIDQVGQLFDTYLYAIDTTAFGRESDQDNNQVVVVLLTDQVNTLSGTCPGGSMILGYFFGLDLLADPNSNNGEVFYGLVPNPTGGNCAVSRSSAQARLPGTFIHEFQHMISFNRHVLLPSTVSSAEETWLNEGLSHFAQELGGRLVPNTECPGFSSCLSEFASDNFINSYNYLEDPEATFLVAPDTSTGSLDERGADWLFVRWLTGLSPTDTVLGTDITRALDGADNANGTTLVGATNAAAVASAKISPGISFASLVSEWQMANYLEGQTGFVDATGRLRYRTVELRTTYTQNPGIFPKGYPCLCGAGRPQQLEPDSTVGGVYARSGTLRAGSGRHLLVLQGGNAPAVDVQLSTPTNVVPRVAVVRIQ